MEADKLALQKEIDEKSQAIEEVIRTYLPREEGLQRTVIEAMHYSIMAGGKRLRPMLMQETYKLCGGQGECIKPFMAAMEMIHTYSLVHDDLPAMDNDEYRRGRKTTHMVYGEGMAVLAGDALLNYAFETALKVFDTCEVDGVPLTDRYRAGAGALSILAKKAGIYGMIGGQNADIEAEQAEEIRLSRLLFIHEHKTAALIEASMMIGAVLAGADEETVKALERCASHIGIAFQIQDDILDVVGDAESLGKPVGSDEKNHKQTYVTMVGLEEAAKEVEAHSEKAISILKSLPGDSAFLRNLTEYLIHRNK